MTYETRAIAWAANRPSAEWLKKTPTDATAGGYGRRLAAHRSQSAVFRRDTRVASPIALISGSLPSSLEARGGMAQESSTRLVRLDIEMPRLVIEARVADKSRFGEQLAHDLESVTALVDIP